jgi:hypothetical protein
MRRSFGPATQWLCNGRACERGWAVPRDSVQAKRPIQSACSGFALEGKHLCNGGRPISNGGGVFDWDSGETDAKGQFHDLLQTGAQTLGVVRI